MLLHKQFLHSTDLFLEMQSPYRRNRGSHRCSHRNKSWQKLHCSGSRQEADILCQLLTEDKMKPFPRKPRFLPSRSRPRAHGLLPELRLPLWRSSILFMSCWRRLDWARIVVPSQGADESPGKAPQQKPTALRQTAATEKSYNSWEMFYTVSGSQCMRRGFVPASTFGVPVVPEV